MTPTSKVSAGTLSCNCGTIADVQSQGFETTVLNYGTDIPSLKGDHKRYLYGPGNFLVTHSDHEHLTVSELEAAVEGYKVLITETLKRRPN